jgi:hypothetical protein
LLCELIIARRDYGEPRLLVMARLDGRLHGGRDASRREFARQQLPQAKQTRGKTAWQKRRKTTGPRARMDEGGFRQGAASGGGASGICRKNATQELMRRSRGRPQKADKKVNQTLRLDPDVLEAFRQEGRGWQARINEILREHMPRRQR